MPGQRPPRHFDQCSALPLVRSSTILKGGLSIYVASEHGDPSWAAPSKSPPFGAITPGAALGTLRARLARTLQSYTYLSKSPCAACAVRPLFMDFAHPPFFACLPRALARGSRQVGDERAPRPNSSPGLRETHVKAINTLQICEQGACTHVNRGGEQSRAPRWVDGKG